MYGSNHHNKNRILAVLLFESGARFRICYIPLTLVGGLLAGRFDFVNPLALDSCMLMMICNSLLVRRIKYTVDLVLFLVVENVVVRNTRTCLSAHSEAASTAR